MSNISPLSVAENPSKERVLKLLEEVRQEVETNATLAVVILPIHPDLNFSTRSAGDIGLLKLAGILGRAWMDATEALKE